MGHAPAHGVPRAMCNQPSCFHRQPLLRKGSGRVVRGKVLSDVPWHSKAVACLATRAMYTITSKSLVSLAPWGYAWRASKHALCTACGRGWGVRGSRVHGIARGARMVEEERGKKGSISLAQHQKHPLRTLPEQEEREQKRLTRATSEQLDVGRRARA